MRNGSIDYLRFLGALGIIWFHMHLPYAVIGLAALHMFIIFLVYFGVGKSISDRASRLLIPWAIWSLIFGAVEVADALASGGSFSDEFKPWMLLTGPAMHLWFLPFAFGFLVLFQWMSGQILWIVAVVVVALSIWATNNIDLQIPLAQWSSVLPSAMLGLLMAKTRSYLVIGLVFAGGAYGLYLVGWDRSTLQIAIGAASVVLVMTIQTPSNVVSRFLSEVSLGMYLVHPLLLAVVARLTISDQYLRFAFVAGAALIITVILKRFVPRAV